MNTVETIHRKVMHLPPREQEEVLDAVEVIEERYRDIRNGSNGTKTERKHVLDAIAELAIDVGISDLAERHDYYAHGKLED